MADGVLYIGNRRYSSWSMRGWLAVRLAGLDVEVKLLRFTRPGPTTAIADVSPNGLVPFLEHDGARVWESLAICDYCAELVPGLWPADRLWDEAHAYTVTLAGLSQFSLRATKSVIGEILAGWCAASGSATRT